MVVVRWATAHRNIWAWHQTPTMWSSPQHHMDRCSTRHVMTSDRTIYIVIITQHTCVLDWGTSISEARGNITTNIEMDEWWISKNRTYVHSRSTIRQHDGQLHEILTIIPYSISYRMMRSECRVLHEHDLLNNEGIHARSCQMSDDDNTRLDIHWIIRVPLMMSWCLRGLK